MAKFWVWDPDGESEESARLIESTYAAFAAEEYAENDADAVSEGLYAGAGHELSVRTESGVVLKVLVNVEYEPQFYSKIL